MLVLYPQEWNPDCMDVSIDLHNRELRALLDELGGHEIRNEGDSFVISFHDALDGITFCLKVGSGMHMSQSCCLICSFTAMYVMQRVACTRAATAPTAPTA